MKETKQYTITNMKCQDLVLNIKHHFKKSKTVLYKERNEIKLLEFGKQKYVVKKFKTPNLLNKFIYSFAKDTKAKRSFDYSEQILDLTKRSIQNNATPNPLGYINFFENFLLCESYYICEYISDCFEMRELIDKSPYSNCKIITKEFTTFTYKLHKAGIFHQDYSSGNILVKKNKNKTYDKNKNTKYVFFVVDVNRMKFMPFDIELGFKNFEKLWANDDMIKVISNQYFNLLSKDGFTHIKTKQKNNKKPIKITKKYCLKQISEFDKKLKEKILLKRKIKNYIKQIMFALKFAKQTKA